LLSARMISDGSASKDAYPSIEEAGVEECDPPRVSSPTGHGEQNARWGADTQARVRPGLVACRAASVRARLCGVLWAIPRSFAPAPPRHRRMFDDLGIGLESPRCDPRSPFEICNECRTELGIFNGTPVGAAGMGAFEVPADKITAWRDYFYVEA